MYGHVSITVLSILLWLHGWKIPPPKGVGVSVAAWACRYARTGEALGPSEKGKTWERRGKNGRFLQFLPINIYCHGKTTQATRVSCPYQPKDRNASCLASPVCTAISYGPNGPTVPIPEIYSSSMIFPAQNPHFLQRFTSFHQLSMLCLLAYNPCELVN